MTASAPAPTAVPRERRGRVAVRPAALVAAGGIAAATADASGQPHVVPVGWSYDAELGTIDVSGRSFSSTREYRNARANPRAAFVVDDVLPPWRPRCVTVQGEVEVVEPADGEALIRIHPRTIISWGLDA